MNNEPSTVKSMKFLALALLEQLEPIAARTFEDEETAEMVSIHYNDAIKELSNEHFDYAVMSASCALVNALADEASGYTNPEFVQYINTMKGFAPMLKAECFSEDDDLYFHTLGVIEQIEEVWAAN